ncbi:MAG TPA: SDR family oxidoreductase [Rhizomicrobium sp.]|jgi:NAD(P)-dependent dehydrogenase (short-subunit alcohol dehydrogenase family)
MSRLSGKIALVTGASRGIGRAAARALAADGAHVIIHYGNKAAEANSLAAEIRGLGGKADVVGADLTAPDAALNLARQVKEITNTLDILMLNAGTGVAAPIEKTTVADFDRVFAINVRAPYFTIQQLLPILSDGASVIFTSSVVARAQVGELSAYAATKGAVNTLVKQLAPVLAARNIRVNAVAPGVIETDLSSFAKSDEGKAYTLSLQALKRIGTPDDIAGAYTFLASDDSRWITGEIIETSGGSKL